MHTRTTICLLFVYESMINDDVSIQCCINYGSSKTTLINVLSRSSRSPNENNNLLINDLFIYYERNRPVHLIYSISQVVRCFKVIWLFI